MIVIVKAVPGQDPQYVGVGGKKGTSTPNVHKAYKFTEPAYAKHCAEQWGGVVVQEKTYKQVVEKARAMSTVPAE